MSYSRTMKLFPPKDGRKKEAIMSVGHSTAVDLTNIDIRMSPLTSMIF